MIISDKWKVLILWDLLLGTKRFGELRKSILDAMSEWGENYQNMKEKEV